MTIENNDNSVINKKKARIEVWDTVIELDELAVDDQFNDQLAYVAGLSELLLHVSYSSDFDTIASESFTSVFYDLQRRMDYINKLHDLKRYGISNERVQAKTKEPEMRCEKLKAIKTPEEVDD